MSKIKQTDIAKLSQLEQQIEQLKEQKKQQEAQLSHKIGGYLLNELDLNRINLVVNCIQSWIKSLKNLIKISNKMAVTGTMKI